MSADIRHYIYTGDNFHKCEPKAGLCAYNIAHTDMRFTYYTQCERKPTQTIDGYEFCKQHARKIMSDRGQLSADKVLYRARLDDFNKPKLIELHVTDITDKKFNVISYKNILGKYNYTALGTQLKHSDQSKGKLFDTEEEAREYLRQCVLNKMKSIQEQYEELKELGEAI